MAIPAIPSTLKINLETYAIIEPRPSISKKYLNASKDCDKNTFEMYPRN